VDIDNASVRSTRENAEANQVSEWIETGLGSVDEVRNGQFTLRRAPVVLANILAPVIIRLFDAGLADLLETPGKMVLSGILVEQAPAVIEAAEAKGLRFIEQIQQGDWVAIALER